MICQVFQLKLEIQKSLKPLKTTYHQSNNFKIAPFSLNGSKTKIINIVSIAS